MFWKLFNALIDYQFALFFGEDFLLFSAAFTGVNIQGENVMSRAHIIPIISPRCFEKLVFPGNGRSTRIQGGEKGSDLVQV